MGIREYTKKLSGIPPKGCDFQVGDIVTFTNEFGVSFKGKKIIGFAPIDNPEAMKAPIFSYSEKYPEQFIYTNSDAYWFPNKAREFKLEKRASQ